ncbi:YaeQ family protein [Ferrovum sp.]|uniref:YaeQ family protein n=1 Tax=Ferrovum sp. TaxID=2609467 RepID=UPI00260D76A0|nr:YaeQ family protein [Ferrovum sp.]
MALKSTIFKANLQISDMDRPYYASHTLTIARHPSETDERMMVRLLAFALHAHEHLTFARGGTADQEESDLWKKDLTGAIDEWIDVGLPDEKRILKACGRARRVIIYAYGGSAVPLWWAGMSSRLKRLSNLSVFSLPLPDSQALARLVERTMDLNCLIQDGGILLSNPFESIPVTVTSLKSFS